MSADVQLERLLYILPAAARPDGARIDDLARALDVTPETVLQDIEAATTRAYYHPAGSTEPFTILIEGDVVRVHAAREFLRPVRLNGREALALGLGLRSLAAEAEQTRRQELLAFAERLEAALVAPDDLAAHGDAVSERMQPAAPGDAEVEDIDAGIEEDVEYEPELLLALGDDGLRGLVADAIEQDRQLTLLYLKPGDAAPSRRRVAPYRLVFAEGRWYIAAHDMEREDFRFFRLDRALDAHIEDAPRPSLPDVDLQAMLRDGAAYCASDDLRATVRYSGRIARWIVEQREGEPQPDGSVIVEHNVADAGWIVRHVLQYGGDARVEAPVQARSWVREGARRFLG